MTRTKRVLTAGQLRKMQAGRARARKRRPARLREVEARMDQLGVEIREAATAEERWARRVELRQLGNERMRLKWGEAK
jgi:hypothetical protein